MLDGIVQINGLDSTPRSLLVAPDAARLQQLTKRHREVEDQRWITSLARAFRSPDFDLYQFGSPASESAKHGSIGQDIIGLRISFKDTADEANRRIQQFLSGLKPIVDHFIMNSSVTIPAIRDVLNKMSPTQPGVLSTNGQTPGAAPGG